MEHQVFGLGWEEQGIWVGHRQDHGRPGTDYASFRVKDGATTGPAGGTRKLIRLLRLFSYIAASARAIRSSMDIEFSGPQPTMPTLIDSW